MKWLKQPGIVKKLQLALVVSLSLNCCLILNTIPQKAEIQEKKTIRVEEEPHQQKTSELEIKNFIKDYLNYFFSTGLVAQSFIKDHSKPSLFEDELKEQLEIRTSKDLKSDLNILDFYIEPESHNRFRVILVGVESFENRDYQNREITMILNLNKQGDDFTVTSIPKFEVKA